MSPTSDSPDPKRDLRLVGDLVEPNPEPAAPAGEPESVAAVEPVAAPPKASSTSYFTWLLLGAALLFAWLWLTQLEKANALAADLAGVEAELSSAKSDIAAWEVYGTRIRSGVDGIALQFRDLQDLLAVAPTSATQPVPSAEPVAAEPIAAGSITAEPITGEPITGEMLEPGAAPAP